MRLATAVIAALLLSGCWFKKKPAVIVPTVPVQPAPAPVPAPPAQPPVSTTPPVTEPVKPSKPSPSPAPAPPAAAPAPAPVPQLGSILTPERRAQMTAEYQKLLAATRSILASTKPAASKAEQTARVRSLIQQAEAARPKDLAAALQLIQRANVLARDLARP